ncbi:ABC transporter substrate-binding protein [Streptomyces sp. NPDC088725]|uniref:ABC transporter substrate-binding protein n=1 Tax=Streptomyces sp. NPDC088725 TaxID=3365873 RepID=UPI00380CF34E
MSASRRRVLTGGAGAALTGAVAACGSDNGRGGASGGSGRPALRQWYHQHGEAGTEQAVRRRAAAFAGADVNIQWRPGNYDEQTAAALLSGDGPDVFEGGPALDQILGGQVAGLTDLVKDVREVFHRAAPTLKTHRGRIYGIPQVIDTQLLYHRKSRPAKAGVRPPQTVNQLLDAARALATRDVKGLLLGNDGGAGVPGGTPLYAAGLSLVTDHGDVGFDDPQAARPLGRIHDLYAGKALLLGAPSDWSDPAALIQGLTALQRSGLRALPQVEQALGDDFGVLPFPSDGPHGSPCVPVGGYGSAVNALGIHTELSRKFVKWLWVDRTDDQVGFALSYGFHIPAGLPLARRADRLKKGAADGARPGPQTFRHITFPQLRAMSAAPCCRW